jgi:hypothetical protein
MTGAEDTEKTSPDEVIPILAQRNAQGKTRTVEICEKKFLD